MWLGPTAHTRRAAQQGVARAKHPTHTCVRTAFALGIVTAFYRLIVDADLPAICRRPAWELSWRLARVRMPGKWSTALRLSLRASNTPGAETDPEWRRGGRLPLRSIRGGKRPWDTR